MGMISDKLAQAQKAASAASGLIKESTPQVAADASKKSSFTVGAQNSVTVLPRRSLLPTKNPNPNVVKPKPKEGEVLFRSARPNLGFNYKNKKIAFRFNWLCTSDKDIIEYLRDEKNAKHFNVSEVKEEKKQEETKT